MIFITLARFRGTPSRESMAKSDKLFAKMAEEGGKVLAAYWTLGRYDAVVIVEGKDEKAAMKALLRWGDIASTETLVAIPREEALKLLE
ncbi:MAG: GYD domain-containing protein [Candidatus Geothermarchaeales archaeon]